MVLASSYLEGLKVAIVVLIHEINHLVESERTKELENGGASTNLSASRHREENEARQRHQYCSSSSEASASYELLPPAINANVGHTVRGDRIRCAEKRTYPTTIRGHVRIRSGFFKKVQHVRRR